MKKTALLLVLLVCSVGWAANWYTAKTGDNSDGLTWATAKTTIAGAIALAGAGDTIFIGTGTYDETVTDVAGLTFDGIDKTAIISRTGNGQKCIVFANNTVVRNITAITTHISTSSIGFYAYGTSNNLVENCNVTGSYDAIVANNSVNFICRNTTALGYFDCFTYAGATGVLVNCCNFSTNDTYGSNSRVIYGGQDTCRATFINCTATATGAAATDETNGQYAAWCKGENTFINCKFKATSISAGNRVVYGIFTSSSLTAKVRLENCSIVTSSLGTGVVADILSGVAGPKAYIRNCSYNPNKVSVTKTIVASRNRSRYESPYWNGRR